MSNPKTYVPKSKAKAVQTQYGEILKLGFKSDVLIEFIQENTNSSGYINLDVSKRRQPDDYGNTHSIFLNDYQPAPKSEKRPASKPVNKTTQEDDVPFN